MRSAANSFQVVFTDSIVSIVFAQRRDYPMFLTTPSSTEHQLRLRPEEQNFVTIGFVVEVSIKNDPILRRHRHIVRVLHSRLPHLATRIDRSKTGSREG